MNYNIYIVKRDRSEAVSISKEVSENQAYRIVIGASINLDHKNWYVDDVEVGSVDDTAYSLLVKQ